MFRDIRTAAGLETRPVCPTCSRGKPRRHAFAGDQRVAPEPFFRRRRPARLQKGWACRPDLKLCLLPPDALDHFPDFKAVGPLARHPPDVVMFPADRALCGAAVQPGPESNLAQSRCTSGLSSVTSVGLYNAVSRIRPFLLYTLEADPHPAYGAGGVTALVIAEFSFPVPFRRTDDFSLCAAQRAGGPFPCPEDTAFPCFGYGYGDDVHVSLQTASPRR